MADIPEKVKVLLKEAGLTAHDSCWQLPQNKKVWIVKHKALEKLAAIKDIRYTDCKVELADAQLGSFAVSVIGHLGDRSEWSIGEASGSNNKNTYPFAMAEKRAKDRVILKLLGLHADFYSEEEADDFKDAEPSDEARFIAHNDKVREHWDSISTIKEALSNQWWEAVAECEAEIPRDDYVELWKAPSKGGIWTTLERSQMKSDEMNAARKLFKESA